MSNEKRIQVWALVQVSIPEPAFPDSPAAIAGEVKKVLDVHSSRELFSLYDVGLPDTAASLQTYPKPKPKPEKVDAQAIEAYPADDMPDDYYAVDASELRK